jgi:CheY-like chemotaxis protein
MPRIDGFSLVERLQRHREYRRIPVVAVNALGRGADLLRTCEAGFSAHLAKPVDPEAIAAQLERVMLALGPRSVARARRPHGVPRPTISLDTRLGQDVPW